MTIIAHPVDNDVRQGQCNDGTMGTVQPAGRFNNADAEWMPACVLASRGGRGGRGGGQDGDVFFAHAHCAIGVTEFFGDTMWLVQCIITLTKSMVHT